MVSEYIRKARNTAYVIAACFGKNGLRLLRLRF